MRTHLLCFLLLISIAGFSQEEFNPPITLKDNAYLHEIVDRVISAFKNNISISNIVDSLKTKDQVLKVKNNEVIKMSHVEDHIFYYTSIVNQFPTTLVFRKSDNIISNRLLFQLLERGVGDAELNFLIK